MTWLVAQMLPTIRIIHHTWTLCRDYVFKSPIFVILGVILSDFTYLNFTGNNLLIDCLKFLWFYFCIFTSNGCNYWSQFLNSLPISLFGALLSTIFCLNFLCWLVDVMSATRGNCNFLDQYSRLCNLVTEQYPIECVFQWMKMSLLS